MAEDDYDLSEPRDVERKKKEARLARRRGQDVLAQIMSTSEGRQWIWNLLAGCRVYHSTFSSEPFEMAFWEGQRNVGLRILADIQLAAPQLYLMMITENGSDGGRSIDNR